MLNDIQANIFERFKNHYVAKFGSEADICGMILDDSTFLRYLRARNFQFDDALKLLDGTIEWRHKFGLNEVCREWLPVVRVEATSKVLVRGFDNQGCYRK